MNNMKTDRICIALLCGAALLLAPAATSANEASTQDTSSEVSATSTTNTADATTTLSKASDKSAKEQDTSAKESASAATAADSDKAWELEAEYLHGSSFKNRRVNVYNLHYFQKGKDIGKGFSLSYGGTLQRATGENATAEHKDIYGNASAVGLGPAVLLRYEYPISGRLTGSIDATGSLLFYNEAHPYDGRAYGFLWRIGPRFSYHYTDKDAITIGWSFHHSSNGMHSHNPGYNGNGLLLAYTHGF